jgi:hypothetical protein
MIVPGADKHPCYHVTGKMDRAGRTSRAPIPGNLDVRTSSREGSTAPGPSRTVERQFV